MGTFSTKTPVKYRKVKLLLLGLLSILILLTVLGVTRRDIPTFQSSIYGFGSQSQSSSIWDDVRELKEKEGNSLPSAPSVEDERVYRPGEEWAGEISATHKIPTIQVPLSALETVPPSLQAQDHQQQMAPKQHTQSKGTQPLSRHDPLQGKKDTKGPPIESNVDYVYEDNGDSNIDDENMVQEKDEISPDAVPTKAVIDPDLQGSLNFLATCSTLECVQKAHKMLKGKTKFNAPHFFLIGFQKCATTSVNHYLRGHPEYMPSVLKEAHYFTACKKSWDDRNCKSNSTKDYLMNYLRTKDVAEDGLNSVTVDASVDYAWKGESLAQEIRQIFPWLKIVVMMREPISRVISYTRMWTQKGVTMSSDDNRIACNPDENLFECVYPHLTPTAYTGHYAIPLEGWLRVWPVKQIHVIQFEDFVQNTESVMRRLKQFLGMNPSLPEKELFNVNTRKATGGSPMKKREYKKLVSMARPDSERVAEMLHEFGLADKDEWMARWEAVWNDVLSSCDTSTKVCTVNSN